jgi:hypothetical protein
MGMREAMRADEVASIRAQLGLSVRELSHELELTPAIIEGFESGAVAVPRKEAQALRYRAAVQLRQSALESSGLAECGWAIDWSAQPTPKSLDAEVKHLESLNAHAAACPTCLAREAYVLERFGPMPAPPLPLWIRVVSPIGQWIERLPGWARPPATMALVFLAMTLLRGLFMAPRLVESLAAFGTFLLAIPLTLALGAAVGFVITGWRVLRGWFAGGSAGPRWRRL